MTTSGGTTGDLVTFPTTDGTPENAASGGTAGAVITAGPSLTGTCPNYPETYLSMEEYWEFLQINEIAGYGIRNYPTTGVMGLGCGDYWDYKNRFWLCSSIQKAERRLEADRWLGFPLSRKYIGPRQLDYAHPLYLGKYVRGLGVEVNEFILARPLVLSSGGVINDPVEFTVAVDFTNVSELIICYPNTLCKIRPSFIDISGGIATVRIPRARLLKTEFHRDYQDVNERPNYETDSNFLSSVDIYRNYLNETTGTNLVWKPPANCQTDLTINRQLAYPYLIRERDGFVELQPATYSGGWSVATPIVKRCPDTVEINFMKFFYDRYEEWDANIKRAVIAVAHNNLPQNYCSCDVQTLYWQNDTRPIEPPIRLGLGMSTWGNYESEQIIREFDRDRNSHGGGLM